MVSERFRSESLQPTEVLEGDSWQDHFEKNGWRREQRKKKDMNRTTGTRRMRRTGDIEDGRESHAKVNLERE